MVIFEFSFTSVSTVSRGHPSLVSLVGTSPTCETKHCPGLLKTHQSAGPRIVHSITVSVVGYLVFKVTSILEKDLTQRVFPLLVRAPSSPRIGYSYSCPPPDLKLGALTKWLASRCWSECFGRLLYKLTFDPSATIYYTVKKGYRFSLPQPVCH